MRLPIAGRCAIIAVLSVVVCDAAAHAQSLFSNRASAGSSQSSGTPSTGSLFSGNVGFPQSASAGSNFNALQRVGGSFIGRSNRGFVGDRGGSQSSSFEGASGDANRRTVGSRSGGERLVERADQPMSTDRQLERSSNGIRQTRIIPRHRIAFEFPEKPAASISDQLTSQLTNLAERYPDFAQIRVTVEPEGIVSLRGQVPSDTTRKLAAILVRLEPGVRGVQNELTVVDERD